MLTPEIVEQSYRIQANPFTRNGMRFEDAMVFTMTVERELKNLTDDERATVECMAQGYTQVEMAEELGISVRTAVRRVGRVKRKMYFDLPEGFVR